MQNCSLLYNIKFNVLHFRNTHTQVHILTIAFLHKVVCLWLRDYSSSIQSNRVLVPNQLKVNCISVLVHIWMGNVCHCVLVKTSVSIETLTGLLY